MWGHTTICYVAKIESNLTLLKQSDFYSVTPPKIAKVYAKPPKDFIKTFNLYKL